MKKINLRKLVVSAILIALSTALSMIPLVQMPLGGKLTPASMLPVCLIGILYGTKSAILPCFLYGTIQMFLGGVFSWGLTPAVLIACILLDYILPYTLLCLSGLFRKKGVVGIVSSISIAMVCRFICHFLSGTVLFRSFDVFNNPYIYSLCYNGAYMLPELVITAVVAALLFKTKIVEKIAKM